MKYILSSFIFISILTFAACTNSETASKKASKSITAEKISDAEYLKKGKQIAAATFVTLSGNLQKAMKSGGVSKAVKYCNLAAFPLVDSLSKVHQAQIRRTSLKIRNPKDRATPTEMLQLKNYEKQFQSNEDLKPVVKEVDEHTIAFYAPIFTMPLCEKCHGKVGDSLLAEDYKVIKAFYPEDEAVGYAGADLRGMWSISFEK